MVILSILEELCSSTVWLSGILTLMFLFVTCLVMVFWARHRWNKKRLPIYHGEDTDSTHFVQQYVGRLTFDRNPRHCNHKEGCQVWAEVSYEGNNSTIIVPFYLNRIFLYNNRMLTSMVLLRTKKPLTDIRSARLMLNCVESCSVSEISESNDLVSQLLIVSLNIQNVLEPNLIATRVDNPVLNPMSKNDSKNRETAYIEHQVHYTFAIERPEIVDMHSIRFAIICPWVSWIVLSFVAMCFIFVLVAFIEVRVAELSIALCIMVIGSSLNAIIFFVSTQYLFVVWIQDTLFVDIFGQSDIGYYLNYGLLLFMMLVGLVSGFCGVTVFESLDDITSEQWRGLEATFISLVVYAALQALVCFIDHKTGLLGNVIWPWSNQPVVCPQLSAIPRIMSRDISKNIESKNSNRK